LGIRSFLFGAKEKDETARASRTPRSLSATIINAHPPEDPQAWGGSRLEASLGHMLFGVLADETDGLAYLFGKGAVPRQERIWNVAFLLVSNALLAIVLKADGVDLDGTKLALSVSKGYVLAQVNGEDRTEISAQAIVIQSKILKDNSEAISRWREVFLQALLGYASTGDRTLRRHMLDLWGTMRYSIYPSLIQPADKAEEVAASQTTKSEPATRSDALNDDILGKFRDRGIKSETTYRHWEFSPEEKGYLDLVVAASVAAGARKEALLHPDTDSPEDVEWEIALAFVPFLIWRSMQPGAAEQLNFGRMVVAYGEWTCSSLREGKIEDILDRGMEKANLLVEHEEPAVRRWSAQYSGAVLGYLESDNAGVVIRELRRVFQYQILPFLVRS
jgi:hypothetical protein